MPEIRVDQEPHAQIFSDLPYPHFLRNRVGGKLEVQVRRESIGGLVVKIARNNLGIS